MPWALVNIMGHCNAKNIFTLDVKETSRIVPRKPSQLLNATNKLRPLGKKKIEQLTMT